MSELIGQILVHRYRVDAFLGRGGMSDVYRVWDLQRDVPLAIKILHEDLAQDKVFLRRFRREAQTLAKLQHPNIVRFYGMEQEGRLTFILMEFVEGHSLRQEIFDSPGPLSNQRIMELMRPICAALNYAHAQGFVHCDVKPANILIDQTGRVLVSDFGIARKTESATATMVGAGTPAYMSPEQARGENPTPQTDIYSLGIMLFEMLSGGERPFIGEHARVTGSMGERIRWEQINLVPPPLRKLNPTVSFELEMAVMKCLEKEPVLRYVDAQKLVQALVQTCVREEKKTEKIKVTLATKKSRWQISRPLAGLRSLLPGGIGIGLTHKPSTYSTKLQVGESQQKQSSRLEKSIASEGEPGALHSAEQISSARILRWVIAAVLLLAVGLTIISGVNLDMPGVVYPPEMGAAMQLVSGLEANAPVLVVFDYQPALSGELEAAAAPVMNDLLLKGARLTILSTTPTGSALAERFMHNTQGHHNYQAGQQYVNLGYLAGGPAGVLDFAEEPSVAAPFTVTGENAWTLNPLQDIQKLSDYSLVLILTDDADTGRVWIEQAEPSLGATPMAMVISAQAESMIRPYYDSGQIKGLVTGLAGGYAYGDVGPAGTYWNAFGVGTLAAEIMIVIGAVWSAIAALRSRQAAKEGWA